MSLGAGLSRATAQGCYVGSSVRQLPVVTYLYGQAEWSRKSGYVTFRRIAGQTGEAVMAQTASEAQYAASLARDGLPTNQLCDASNTVPAHLPCLSSSLGNLPACQDRTGQDRSFILLQNERLAAQLLRRPTLFSALRCLSFSSYEVQE